MEPSEIEFLSEKTPVEIIPNFNHHGIIHLISGNVGPFRAGLPAVVPLWLGVNLKQRNKCRILSPDWMDVEKLEDKKEEEKKSKFFTKMPHENYLEVTHLLLDVAGDDISRADDVRTLVKDLWDMRISKLRSSIDTLVGSGGIHASLNHLTQLEINSVRPLLPDALNLLQALQECHESEEEENTDSQSTSRNSASIFNTTS
ncbi:DNA replication complex GINS protein PSF2 [Planococcus citri]|uniref:DNA replication complex GINS protein PSF2 n=1 Tax=Planococcus citri TaxID=170843 RepID=UPI0031F912D2